MKLTIDQQKLSDAMAAAQIGLRDFAKRYHPAGAVLRTVVKPNRHKRRAAKARRRGR